jgi:tetratricopeptide (TPR) repeat protein
MPLTSLRLPVLAAVVAALPAAPLAQAQTLSEPALEALYLADRTEELRRAVQPRVAARADDEQAVLGLALVALGGDDAAARKAAIAAAEACIEKAARSAACQWSLGTVAGIQAMSEGMMAAARSLGRVRDALVEAHRLAPAWWPARSSLAQFYLMAPGMLGGSAAKAEALGTSAPTPEGQKALAARMAIHREQNEAALAALAAHRPGADAALDADVRGWGRQAAFALVNGGQPAKARAWFEQQLRERPGDALPAFGLARVLAETGQPQEALALYERAARGRGAAELPIAYRVGIAQQQAGQPEAAKASFRSYLAAGKGSKRTLDDARKRLDELGG